MVHKLGQIKSILINLIQCFTFISLTTHKHLCYSYQQESLTKGQSRTALYFILFCYLGLIPVSVNGVIPLKLTENVLRDRKIKPVKGGQVVYCFFNKHGEEPTTVLLLPCAVRGERQC